MISEFWRIVEILLYYSVKRTTLQKRKKVRPTLAKRERIPPNRVL
jgi:hypothetical protein